MSQSTAEAGELSPRDPVEGRGHRQVAPVEGKTANTPRVGPVSTSQQRIAELARYALGMAVAIAWLPGPAGTRRRVAKLSVEEPDAAEPARPDLWGARVSNDPGLPDHADVLTPFLRSLVERGLDVSQGVLVILDGGKGLRSAVRKAFRNRALVQRCQWHKRENVVRYLAKREQASWRQRLQRAYNRPAYDEALPALETLQRELEDRNQSAAGSLAEGLDETLTLHRLGLYGVLGRSLKTTNCLEFINALVEERCAKVDHWQNSSQRHRWLATALLDIEPRLRKVMGYRHLPTLRAALKRELKIDMAPSKTKAA